MDTVVNDTRFQQFVINLLIPFPVILNQAGFDGYSYNGKCYCP